MIRYTALLADIPLEQSRKTRPALTPDGVECWQQGLRSLFQVVQIRNGWTPVQAWAELYKYVKTQDPSTPLDDLEWLREIIMDERDCSFEEGVRVAQRYEHRTPAIDALKSFM